MAEIKISCENCGQHIQCDDAYCGMQIDCPICKKAFVVPASTESENQNRPSGLGGGLILLILIWLPTGAFMFLFKLVDNDWEFSAAHLFRFSVIWIGAGVCLGVLLHFIARALQSSKNYKQLDDAVMNLPTTSDKWDKKHPSFPWAGVVGIILLVIMLWRNWDSVGHFLSSAGTKISAALPSRTISENYTTTEGNEQLLLVGKLFFHKDGTVVKDTTFYNLNGTYRISGDMITITWTGGKDFSKLITETNRAEQYQISGSDLLETAWNNHLWYKTQ